MAEGKSSSKRLTAKRLKTGDHLACVQYYTVTDVPADEDGGHQWYRLQNEEGANSDVAASVLENEFFSANQFDRTELVTQTDIIHRLMSAGDTVFEATFHKQLVPKDIEALLVGASPQQLANKKDRAALVKRLLQGEERTLTGYLIQCEPDFARSTVVDLNIEAPKNKIIAKDRIQSQSLLLHDKPNKAETQGKGKEESSGEAKTAVKNRKRQKRDDNDDDNDGEAKVEAKDEPKKAEWDPRIRQIDHRTLKQLIIKNVCYKVKNKK